MILCQFGNIFGRGHDPETAYNNYKKASDTFGCGYRSWADCEFYKTPLPLKIEERSVPVMSTVRKLVVKGSVSE